MSYLSAPPKAQDLLDSCDIAGLCVLLTGASSGIGLETARVLAANGAHVTAGVRNLSKARAAAATVGLTPGDDFCLVELDLNSGVSIRRCVDHLNASNTRFDLIIANAGMFAYALERTEEGFETTLASNFLGHFQLINGLVPAIKSGGRVVMVASNGHRFFDIDLDDINFERRAFSALAAYGGAKTAEILFAAEFDRRHRARGIRATALNPGAVDTGLVATMPDDVAHDIYTTMVESGADPESFAMLTLEQGAATTIWAAVVAPAELVGGRYCENCRVADTAVDGSTGVKPYALDAARAKRLWDQAEAAIGRTL